MDFCKEKFLSKNNQKKKKGKLKFLTFFAKMALEKRYFMILFCIRSCWENVEIDPKKHFSKVFYIQCGKVFFREIN